MDFTKKELKDFLESDSEKTFEEYKIDKKREEISNYIDEILKKTKGCFFSFYSLYTIFYNLFVFSML